MTADQTSRHTWESLYKIFTLVAVYRVSRAKLSMW